MSEISRTERVPDEELDQMIWKLERDGMTPKMLSLMRELREVRREKGEPVAWMYDGEDGREYNGHNEFSGGGKGVPLYTAPPAPPAYKKTENFTDYHAGWNACRAAMLNHSEHERDMVEPVSQPYKLPSQSSDAVNEAAWKLHDTLTEHGPLNGHQFNNLKGCFYEALKVAMYNSPVIPEGWQLVPVEPTKEMIDAGWLHFMGTKNPSSKGTYKAMLAAAPQQEVKP